jgi:hypothetical protein
METQNKTWNRQIQQSLFLNYPVTLSIYVGWEALEESTGQEMLGDVFQFLSASPDDFDASAVTATVLRRIRFNITSGRDFGITDAVDEWLMDAGGQHLRQAVARIYGRQGFRAASEIINAWQASNNNASSTRAEAKAREVLAELDLVRTLCNHAVCLSAIIGELEKLQNTIESRIIPVAERFAGLSRHLQTVRAASQNAAQSPPQTVIAAPRWNDISGQFNRFRNRFFTQKQPVTMAAASTAPTTTAIERDLLTEQIRLGALEAERAIVGETLDLLRQEKAADHELLDLFAEVKRTAALSARKAESTRNYGLAAGELLLNGEELTRAITRYLFSDAANTESIVLMRFAEMRGADNALSVIANLSTNDMVPFVADIFGVCRELMREKLSNLTIADALTALLMTDEMGWYGRLTAAFKATVSKDFLAQNWTTYLIPEVLSAVIYAPSLLPETNERLRDTLVKIRQGVRLNFDIKLVAAHRDRLLFYCEFFSIPLEAFRFYDASKADFEMVENLPQYNPHALFRNNLSDDANQ